MDKVGDPCPKPAVGDHHCPLEPDSPHQGPGISCCSAACAPRTRDSSASLPGQLAPRPDCRWKVPVLGAGMCQGQHTGSPWDTTPPAMPTVLPHLPALPIRIVKPLRDKTVLARHKATLECTVSHARGRVRWLRGDTEIFAGDKYEICNLDCYRTLIIHRVGPEDEDSYTCDAFDDRSTARLLVEGEEAPGGDHWGLGVPSSLTAEGRWRPCSHIPLLARVYTLGLGERAGHGTRGLCPHC